jgi:hypothetical protein
VTTRLGVGAVLGDHRMKQAVAVREVILQCARVALAGRSIYLAK